MKAINVTQICEAQAQLTHQWHETRPELGLATGLAALVEKNHLANFQLWHQEDEARRDDLGFEPVYRAKRQIDAYNQQRNDLMQRMDEWVLTELKPSTDVNCPVNSETPGMIIDRLSILALKRYHMAEQTVRTDVQQSHLDRCQQKLTVIDAQVQQLAICLTEFLAAIESQTRTFRVYHQFKMYNDPNLNPQLYGNKTEKKSHAVL